MIRRFRKKEVPLDDLKTYEAYLVCLDDRGSLKKGNIYKVTACNNPLHTDFEWHVHAHLPNGHFVCTSYTSFLWTDKYINIFNFYKYAKDTITHIKRASPVGSDYIADE
jgi:hypothetical protein